MARLQPALRHLVVKITADENQYSEIDSSAKLTRQLEQSLRTHVFNQLPIRLLALPEMKLIERDEIINHISDKLGHLKHHKNIRAMLKAVKKLAESAPSESSEEQEEV